MSTHQPQLEHFHHLSSLVLALQDAHANDYEFSIRLKEQERQKFIRTAINHRILVRSLCALANHAERSCFPTPDWILAALTTEQARTPHALNIISSVCAVLDTSGFPAVVIKSLDHFPDLGSDFDIYTSGSERDIKKLMRENFDAQLESKSLSERLACKYRFRIPNLEKPLEIHRGRLGQTGQQVRMGRLILQRRVKKSFGGHKFTVPAPEDQILLRVVDRFYRHYCLRLCDIADIAQLIQSSTLDFEYLKNESKRAGIRKGVCAYLEIVDQFYWLYRGEHLRLPPWVWKGASFDADSVYVHAGLLRIPLFPQSAGLFTHELAKAIRRKDIKKSLRTGVIPALAVAAAARFRITGRDKGIW